MTDTAPRGGAALIRALRWSFAGLRASWQQEASFRLEVALAVVLVPLGLWLGNNGVERALLVGAWLLVLIVELLNSSIETLLDRLHPERDPAIGRAKDIGSAAVFVAIVNAALCWALILVPRGWQLVH